MNHILVTVMLILGLVFPFSKAFAGEHSKAELQTLNDSATALKSINPSLADKLSRYAAREADEKEQAEEAEENEASENGNIQMLKDAASALKASRPDLADSLSQYADKEAKEEEKEDRE